MLCTISIDIHVIIVYVVSAQLSERLRTTTRRAPQPVTFHHGQSLSIQPPGNTAHKAKPKKTLHPLSLQPFAHTCQNNGSCQLFCLHPPSTAQLLFLPASHRSETATPFLATISELFARSCKSKILSNRFPFNPLRTLAQKHRGWGFHSRIGNARLSLSSSPITYAELSTQFFTLRSTPNPYRFLVSG